MLSQGLGIALGVSIIITAFLFNQNGNLKEDLGEKKDLAPSMPDKVKELDGRLVSHLKSVGARLPRPNPAYKGKRGRK